MKSPDTEGERVQADITATIITWNRKALLREALQSVLNSSVIPRQVIVVNNNSTDGAAELLATEFPQVKVIHNRENRDCIYGRNQAIEASEGRYILFLDDDARLGPNCLKILYDTMEQNPKLGICGPQLIYPNGDLQPSCRAFPTEAAVLIRGTVLGNVFPHCAPLRHYLMMDADLTLRQNVDWMITACLLARRAMLRQIGAFDIRLTAYEETDLCFRAWKAGWEVEYTPAARCVHRYQRLAARNLWSRRKLNHIASLCRLFAKHGLFLRRPQPQPGSLAPAGRIKAMPLKQTPPSSRHIR